MYGVTSLSVYNSLCLGTFLLVGIVLIQKEVRKNSGANMVLSSKVISYNFKSKEVVLLLHRMTLLLD